MSAITQSESDIFKQQAPANLFEIGDPPNFQIQVANVQLEKPIATAVLKFSIGGHFLTDNIIGMKNLTGPIVSLPFTRHNILVTDTTHGIIHFPHLKMQVKSAARETSDKSQPLLFHNNITVPLMTTKTLTAFLDYPSEWHTTCNLTPVGKFVQATKSDKKIAVRVINTMEKPYSIKKDTQIDEVSAVTPEQSNFIKPVDTAILSMILEADPDLTTHLNELLRTRKPQQQNNTFWFPTPENPDKTEDHTPLQILILKELRELKENEKLNPGENLKTRVKYLERFDWIDTLLTETED